MPQFMFPTHEVRGFLADHEHEKRQGIAVDGCHERLVILNGGKHLGPKDVNIVHVK